MINYSNLAIDPQGVIKDVDAVAEVLYEEIDRLNHSESRGNKQLRIERKLSKSLRQELNLLKAQLALIVEDRDNLLTYYQQQLKKGQFRRLAVTDPSLFNDLNTLIK